MQDNEQSNLRVQFVILLVLLSDMIEWPYTHNECVQEINSYGNKYKHEESDVCP